MKPTLPLLRYDRARQSWQGPTCDPKARGLADETCPSPTALVAVGPFWHLGMSACCPQGVLRLPFSLRPLACLLTRFGMERRRRLLLANLPIMRESATT